MDPINQRPSIDIHQTTSDTVYRTNPVTLEAVSSDPEGQVVFFQWRAYACIDANDRTTCDAVPFQTEVLRTFTFIVPEGLVDQPVEPGEPPVPVQSILVILEAEDDYGAIARPAQQLIIPVGNYAPTLQLNNQSKYEWIVNTPIELSAKYTDLDDGTENIDLEWTVFSPMNQPTYDLVEFDIVDTMPDKEIQEGQRLTPHGTGMWQVRVVASDQLGAMAEQVVMFEVKADPPPCLAQWAPIAAPTGSALPFTDATLFKVNVVRDVLDPFPTVGGDAFLGTTKFTWSIQQPGSSVFTEVMGFDGNALPLDPGNYAPGDDVAVRVHIRDRVSPTPTCPDDTCSVISDNSCIQRLTWRLEVQ
jgi:hypothetical protein